MSDELQEMLPNMIRISDQQRVPKPHGYKAGRSAEGGQVRCNGRVASSGNRMLAYLSWRK